MRSLFLLLFFGSATVASAASWYVDKDALGSNNGTSWSNAWATFSAVKWGAGGVSAGDTLFISGGTTSKNYYTNTLTVGAKGTSSAPITLRVGQEAGHNGMVIFDYDAYGDFATTMGVNASQAWLKFDGEFNGASHWLFANLRNITNRSTAYAIYGGAAYGAELKFLTFTNCNQGIRLQNLGAYGVKIYRCDFLQIRGNGAISVLDSGSATMPNLIYSNRIELACNTAVPPGAAGAYGGPDGIHVPRWSSIYNNTFRIRWNTNIFTSCQHPDYLQTSGTNISIFNNEFINIGDSAIDIGIQDAPGTSDILIYNNVFRIEEAIDPFPEYIRMYAKQSVPAYPVRRCYVFNNTFIDNPYSTTYFAEWWNTNFVGSFQFMNNLFYNCGGGKFKAICRLGGWTNYAPGDVVFQHNLYYNNNPVDAYHNFFGVAHPTPDWVSKFGLELGGKTSRPIFMSYTPNGSNNNLRLNKFDTAARGAGVDLSQYFTTDKDGNPRTGAWDIGAYQYQPSAPPTPQSQLRIPQKRTLRRGSMSSVVGPRSSDSSGP